MAYTAIDDPSAHHQTVIYTGGGNDSSVTFGGNSDLQLDFLWVKRRDDSDNSKVFDTSRGIGGGDEPYLTTVSNEAEQTYAYLTSVNSDGFTWDTTDNSTGASGNTYVAWGWKANGGTRVTFTESGDNPAGGYQANTTAGFSIVDYVGTGGAGTVSHGLGVAPYVVILKARDGSDSNEHWRVGHNSMAWTHRMQLNETNAKSDDDGVFNDTAPTSSVFTIGDGDKINTNDENMIAYVWAPIQGYSKFGSYTGNGDADGPFVYTGFKPAWTIIKRSDTSNDGWYIHDSTRSPFNQIDKAVKANLNSAEGGEIIHYVSNGFKHRIGANANFNADGGTYIYMAFAEEPFVTSTGIPATAR